MGRGCGSDRGWNRHQPGIEGVQEHEKESVQSAAGFPVQRSPAVPAWCPGTVHAEELTGSRDWLVEFDGEEMQSNFSSQEMAEGDLWNSSGRHHGICRCPSRNSGKDAMDWYLSNEILKSLEERKPGGRRSLYLSSGLYGWGRRGDAPLRQQYGRRRGKAPRQGEGLHQATNALEDFLYLDQLDTGEEEL